MRSQLSVSWQLLFTLNNSSSAKCYLGELDDIFLLYIDTLKNVMSQAIDLLRK